MTTQDAEIVRLEDSPIYYSQSEPLVRNIDRHVQLSYPFYMFGEKSFEIDEDGPPLVDLSREGFHHRTLRWRDHQSRGAV